MAQLRKGMFPGVGDDGQQFLRDIVDELANIKAAVDALRTSYNGHVHGGVTAGAASTSAGPTSATTTGTVTSFYDDNVN